MPKIILMMLYGVSALIVGYMVGAFVMLQDGVAHVVQEISPQAGTLALLIVMVDRLLSFVLKFKKDKVEMHLETIKVEAVKQSYILNDVRTATVQNGAVLGEVRVDLKSGLQRQQDIYSKYLRKPKAKG